MGTPALPALARARHGRHGHARAQPPRRLQRRQHRDRADAGRFSPALRHQPAGPTIDRRHTGRSSRHGWFATIDQEGPYGFEFAGICHRDSRTGTEESWDPGAFERAGEAFFAPGGSAEGESWLLSFLYDCTTDRSSPGIFDAQAVADGPLARVHLPVRVPYGFHGLWIDEDDLA